MKKPAPRTLQELASEMKPEDYPPNLRNWPPGRGPKPASMRLPRNEAPVPRVELLPHKTKPAPRVVPPPAPPPVKGHRPGVIVTRNLLHADDAQRNWNYHLNQHVATVATLTLDQAINVLVGTSRWRDSRRVVLAERLPVRTITVDLDYPLSKIARVTIAPYVSRFSERDTEKRMTLGYVLWQLARVYRQIYRAHRRWGVWGHAIDDLQFESFTLRDNLGTVGIGS